MIVRLITALTRQWRGARSARMLRLLARLCRATFVLKKIHFCEAESEIIPPLKLRKTYAPPAGLVHRVADSKRRRPCRLTTKPWPTIGSLRLAQRQRHLA